MEKDVYKEKILGTYGKSNGVISLKEVPFFKHQLKIVLENCGVINPTSIDAYIAHGGFKALDKVIRLMKPEEVIKEVLDSGLRGRGGGGFPTGKKWEFATKAKIRSEIHYLQCR